MRLTRISFPLLFPCCKCEKPRQCTWTDLDKNKRESYLCDDCAHQAAMDLNPPPMDPAMQLQLWDATTKRYTPAPVDAPRGKAWRLCKADRPTVNPKHRPPAYRGSAYTVREVCAQYCQWARDKNLETVTNWKHAGKLPGFLHTRLVDAKTYFDVTTEYEQTNDTREEMTASA